MTARPLLGTAAAWGLLLGLCGTALAESHKLDGMYRCVGENGDGTEYEGTVRIAKTGETYEVSWTIQGSTYVGVGIIENDRLCCSWATNVNGRVTMGMAVYKMEKGKLSGRWTCYPGTGRILKETLTLKD